MSRDFDTIVLGLGAMGSATSWQLAKRGARVLGLDRHVPPHTFGSSHGDTRITRQAIGEGDFYSPLVLRAHELWREIEQATGQRLLVQCGALIIAGSSSASARKPGFFNNTVAAARKFGIPHELLSARQMRERFPQFKLGDDEHAYYEPGAGYVRPEECIRAQLELAARAGAELRTNERVRAFHQEGNRVVVETEHTRYTAGQLVVSAGAGAPELLGDGPAALLTVLRQVLFWFEPQRNREQFEPGKFPVFIWNLPGTQDIYGFPMAEGSTGMKIATEQYNVPTTMDTADRTVSPDEITRMYRNHVAPHFPDIGEHCVKTVACLYTATPDSNFIIDRLAGQDRVVVASPCSGHGFKHSAAVGEAIAEIVVDGKSRLDLSRFGFARFAR